MEALELELVSSLSFTTEHALIHRVKGTEIYREIHTKMNKRTGNPGKSTVIWYHRSDKKSHATYEEAAAFKEE